MPKVHLLSLVVSVYNEEESLNLFWQETEKYLRASMWIMRSSS